MSKPIHGEANKSPEYLAWTNMIQRCSRPSHPRYSSYGGRGIKVCKRWQKSYLNFLEDIGRKPNPKYSLDRIDNDGNYEPDNCRWATREEQNNNKRNTPVYSFQGKTQSLSAWAKEKNIKYYTLRSRLYLYGWSIEKSLSETVG